MEECFDVGELDRGPHSPEGIVILQKCYDSRIEVPRGIDKMDNLFVSYHKLARAHLRDEIQGEVGIIARRFFCKPVLLLKSLIEL